LKEKRITLKLEGIEHITLEDDILKEKDNFRAFLLANRLLPQNTLFVLFPMIGYFETFFTMIHGYRYIADIVDNQLGWKSKYPERIVQQYKVLAKNAEYIIFNSDNNRQFFMDHGFLEKDTNDLVITNWYELPKVINKSIKIDHENREKYIFYSGNMNDRIDWDLIQNLLEVLPNDIKLYLIGSAQRSSEKIKDILSKYTNCQFLGPIDERSLINFIQSSLFSIMPHTVESTSKYMNPLKVHMFAALGIECISTDVPGLETRFQNLIICKNEDLFISECLERVKNKNDIYSKKKINLDFVYEESRDIYFKIILDVFKKESLWN